VPPAECPGSVSEPAASAGHVCVFAGATSNASSFAIGDPETGVAPGASRFGVYVSAVGDLDSNYFLSGTWAVTAP
jgi:hypothetical protein